MPRRELAITRRDLLKLAGGVLAISKVASEASAQRLCSGQLRIHNELYRERNGVVGYQRPVSGKNDNDIQLGPRSGVPFIVQVDGSVDTITGFTNAEGDVQSLQQGKIIGGVNIEGTCTRLSDGNLGLKFTVVNGIRGTRSAHEVHDKGQNRIQKWSEEVPGVTEAVTPSSEITPLPRPVTTTPAPSDLDVRPALVGTARATRTPGVTLTPTKEATFTPTLTPTETTTSTQTPTPTSTETATPTFTITPESTATPYPTPTYEVTDPYDNWADRLTDSDKVLLTGVALAGIALFTMRIRALRRNEADYLEAVRYNLATDSKMRDYIEKLNQARQAAFRAILNEDKINAANLLIAAQAARGSLNDGQIRILDRISAYRRKLAQTPKAVIAIGAEEIYRSKINNAATSGLDVDKLEAINQLTDSENLLQKLESNDPLKKFDDQLNEASKIKGRKRVFPWIGRWNYF